MVVVVVDDVVVVVTGGAVVDVVGGTVVVVVDAVVLVVDGVVVDVVTGGAVVVVVPWQTNAPSGEPAPQESQQLVPLPAHAWPPFGALHLSALDLMEHFVLPFLSTRQQVTDPGLPQIDRAAQLVTSPRHSLGRSPDAASSFTTRLTQR